MTTIRTEFTATHTSSNDDDFTDPRMVAARKVIRLAQNRGYKIDGDVNVRVITAPVGSRYEATATATKEITS
jgi:hypothetical protein